MDSSAQLVQHVIDRIGLQAACLLFGETLFTIMAWQQGAALPDLASRQAETLITCYDKVRDVDGPESAFRWILYGETCVASPLMQIAQGYFAGPLDDTDRLIVEEGSV